MKVSIKDIVVAGKNDIAVYAANLITKSYSELNLRCVCNNNDDGIDHWQPSLKNYALKNNIEIVSLEDCYSEEKLLFISLEFDKIIDINLFKSNQLFNIHFSKLPSYKGMYTSCLPLLNGESESGVTLHKIDNGVDTGEIVDQETFSIQNIKSAKELYLNYIDIAKKILKRNLELLISNKIESYAQDTEKSSYFSRNSLDFKNIKIDLNKTAFQISNQIRAYNFEDYQLPIVHGNEINGYKITDKKSFEKSGTIKKEDKEKLTIATIDYDLILYKKI